MFLKEQNCTIYKNIGNQLFLIFKIASVHLLQTDVLMKNYCFLLLCEFIPAVFLRNKKKKEKKIRAVILNIYCSV